MTALPPTGSVPAALGALAEPISPTLLVTMAGGYISLYLFSAGVCLLGSVLVYRIRSVR